MTSLEVLPGVEDGLLTDPSKKKKTIDSPYLHSLQLRHFVLFDVLPALGTLVAIGLCFVYPIGRVELSLLFVMWLLTGCGITVGFHRLFTHRSFKAAGWVRACFVIFGCMAAQGAVISWVAIHRRHHEFSDKPGDPHSPNLHGAGFRHRLRGLIHSHYSWMARHEYPNILHYAPDLMRDKALIKLDSYYTFWVLLGIAVPAAIGGVIHGTWLGVLYGALWGGAVRLFLLGNIIWMINSVLHSVGTRRFATREHSRNAAVLSLITLGESWHNNHHAFPASASFGLNWYYPDPGYWFIKSLKLMGLAWDVYKPAPDKIRAQAQPADAALPTTISE
jgi:stearoyl-CoA desaturase (Delta-9 desaturase)